MDRRTFSKKAAYASVATLAGPALAAPVAARMKRAGPNGFIRLGGPVPKSGYDSPESWIEAVRKKGYTAALCPVDETADVRLVDAYRQAAVTYDVVIAEVGVWNNPIHPDKEERKAAVEKCIRKLELADRIEARCCVNVSGSRGGESIGGPHEKNLTEETFHMIVETTREIIDAVKPSRTYYTLEMMPYAYPDSVESYLELIKAIDRKEVAVHFDPVNLMNSPGRYYGNADIIRDAFSRLGRFIKSCHAKDTMLESTLTLHIDETVPGRGNLDYRVYLKELSKLDQVPLIMEHMDMDEYDEAAEYIRRTGREMGLEF